MLDGLPNVILGFLGGFATKVFYDRVTKPKLKIDRNEGHLEYVQVFNNNISYWVCRIFVHNKKKWFFNNVAESCTAWIQSPTRLTKEQINWVGDHPLKNINQDDYDKVNLFAVQQGTNHIYFGTENGLFPSRQPFRQPVFRFRLKITSSNAHSDITTVNVSSITWTGHGVRATPTITVNLSR